MLSLGSTWQPAMVGGAAGANGGDGSGCVAGVGVGAKPLAQHTHAASSTISGKGGCNVFNAEWPARKRAGSTCSAASSETTIATVPAAGWWAWFDAPGYSHSGR